MIGLVVAMSAIAGPGRITVTNEAGAVFKDVEVLSEGGGVVTVKTTNGVEFIKPAGLPPELRDKVSRQEQQRTNAAPTPLFTQINPMTDEFTGAASDLWLAQAHGPKWEATLFLAKVSYTNTPFNLLTFYLRTAEGFYLKDEGGLEAVADGAIMTIPSTPAKHGSRIEMMKELFCYEWAAYMIDDDVLKAVKDARSLKLRLNGSDTVIVVDLPKMAGRYPSKKLEPVIQVTDCVARTTEQNSTWWRWSYQFRVVNNDDVPVLRTFNIRFLDAAGFVVDETTEYSVGIMNRSSKIVRGYDLVDAKVSPNIRSIDVKVEPR